MLGMFGGYKGINYLDLSNFNTSKVTNMANMFTYCTAKTLNLSSFDISNVTSFSNMF
jgi:surface protein